MYVKLIHSIYISFGDMELVYHLQPEVPLTEHCQVLATCKGCPFEDVLFPSRVNRYSVHLPSYQGQIHRYIRQGQSRYTQLLEGFHLRFVNPHFQFLSTTSMLTRRETLTLTPISSTEFLLSRNRIDIFSAEDSVSVNDFHTLPIYNPIL